MILSEVVRVLEEVAPPRLAVPDDKIGLQVGDPAREVGRVVTTLDVTPAVIAEAARRSADLIVAHHPLIYAPMPGVRADIYPQSLVYKLVQSGIALYAMHTNFDSADGGVNDTLAERLGIEETEVLEPVYTEAMYKIVIFAPEEAAPAVTEAMADAGAGAIGNYTHCSFQSPGIGAFLPLPGAQPHIGEIGQIETVEEIRIEVIVQESILDDVVDAMLEAHPYEEVAYDVYKLEVEGESWGLGRYGKLRTPMTFEGFCEMVRDVLEVDDARVYGDPEAHVSTVAILGGSGGSRIRLAHSKGVDAFVTGDVNHHQALEALAIGLNVIDATHFRTERPGMIAVTPRLRDLLGVEVEYADDVTLSGG